MKKHETATRAVKFLNIRRNQVIKLTAALFREIEPALNEGQHREVHHLLFEALSLNSVMLMSEKDRAELGLEPRDQLGYTPSERVQIDDAYNEATRLSLYQQFPQERTKNEQ